MPTLVSESAQIERELWTADDFLDWLQPEAIPKVSGCLREIAPQ